MGFGLVSEFPRFHSRDSCFPTCSVNHPIPLRQISLIIGACLGVSNKTGILVPWKKLPGFNVDLHHKLLLAKNKTGKFSNF